MEFMIKGIICYGFKLYLGVNVVDVVCLVVNVINVIRVNLVILNFIKVINILVKGEIYNNILDEVFMVLDIRVESNDIIEELKEKVIYVVKIVVSFINVEVVLIFKDGVLVVEFDEEFVNLVEEIIKDVLGVDVFIGIFKNFGGEDFYYYI